MGMLAGPFRIVLSLLPFTSLLQGELPSPTLSHLLWIPSTVQTVVPGGMCKVLPQQPPAAELGAGSRGRVWNFSFVMDFCR